MHINNAKPGMILSRDLLDDNGNLLLEEGITLTETYIGRLKKMGIRLITVYDSKSKPVNQVPAITSQLRAELTQSFRALYTMKLEEILNPDLRTIRFRGIAKATDQTIDELTVQLPNIMNVQVRQPGTDEINHAVNVCLLSVIVGLYLRLPHSMLQHLAMGALLHDLGKSIIPLIDGKPINSPNMHTLYGRDLLLKSQQHPIISRIAAEHHEAYNGTGYPFGLSNASIHPLSRIVALANYFDITMTDATQQRINREEVVEKMMGSGNTLFDVNLLRAFFNTIAIYPVGSLVRLNNGQTGYVVKNRPHFPLRPVVRIVSDSGHTDINLVYKPNMIIVEVEE